MVMSLGTTISSSLSRFLGAVALFTVGVVPARSWFLQKKVLVFSTRGFRVHFQQIFTIKHVSTLKSFCSEAAGTSLLILSERIVVAHLLP